VGINEKRVRTVKAETDKVQS